MHRATLILALPLLSLLTVLSFASVARADVAPRCKCEAPGGSAQGGLAAVMAVTGASALLIGRARRRRG